jgi:hypothetical protein
MLAQAAALKVDVSRLRLTVTITPPKWLGSSRYPTLQAENESLPFADKLLLTITATALTNAPEVVRCQGEYVASLSGFNLWAGDDGGWQSGPAKAFRVTSIPACYVINTNGMIVEAGHPMSLHAPEVVNRLLK